MTICESAYTKSLRSYPNMQLIAVSSKKDLCYSCKAIVVKAFSEINDLFDASLNKKFCSAPCLKAYISKSFRKNLLCIPKAVVNG